MTSGGVGGELIITSDVGTFVYYVLHLFNFTGDCRPLSRKKRPPHPINYNQSETLISRVKTTFQHIQGCVYLYICERVSLRVHVFCLCVSECVCPCRVCVGFCVSVSV